jgi:lipoyl(octanoyl) transferase
MQVRVLGRVEYLPTFQAMAAFTEGSGPGTPDELWLCEHPPVFTQGLAGKADHVLEPGDIPVVATNRGGQVTYHGPGQVVAYPLLDLKRAGYFVKEYVYRLEEAWSAPWPLRRDRAPGGGRAGHLCPAGRPRLARGADRPGAGRRPLRRAGQDRGAGHQGEPAPHLPWLALNVGMDLEPFERINPCGYAGLRTVDLSTIGVSTTWNEAAAMLGHELQALLAPQDIP